MTTVKHFTDQFRLHAPGILILSLTCLLGAPAHSQPAASPIVVTEFRTTQLAVLGRYATANCTIRNSGAQPVPLKDVAVFVQRPGGADETFNVAPPHLPVGTLAPGATYSFRQFKQMKTAGSHTCIVKAQHAGGGWTPLTLAAGRAAVATLRVVPADSVPQARFEVTDPQPRHIYRTGDTIHLQVMPVLTGGDGLTAQVGELKISTPVKPFSSTDPARARDLLLSGHNDQVMGFIVDFWAVPEAQKYVDLAVDFKQPVTLSSFSLGGVNLNGEYSLKSSTVDALQPGGATTRVPTVTLAQGNSWTMLAALKHRLTATGLRWRVTTPYKLNLTALSVQGSAEAGTAVASAAISYRWQDASGKPLSAPASLTPFEANAVSSPPNLRPGYYGLAMTTRIAGVDPAQREYGFVVLPPAAPAPAGDPCLGMVHMHLEDTNLGVGWVKTISTNFYDIGKQTLDVAGLRRAIADRAARGYTEVPLIGGTPWHSDATRPVDAAQLQQLKTMMLQHFQAVPEVHYWELGLEENLGWRGHRTTWPYFWSNLEAKARVVREAATEAKANVQFIYQIAELDPQSVDDFCQSGASRYFSILALHPYAWPDFPPPEKWMPEYIAKVHASMARYHAEKPIWFTEIGAPHNGNPGGFFGYPSIPAYDRGLSRDEHAAYLVKCHLVAWRLGVEKIFWYNYQDAGGDPEYAEHHFGLVDYWGYPKPSYAAYCTLSRLLRGKTLQPVRAGRGDVQVERFNGATEDCLVLWAYPAPARPLALATLGLGPRDIVEVMDLFGKPLTLTGAKLSVSGAPLYVVVRHRK